MNNSKKIILIVSILILLILVYKLNNNNDILNNNDNYIEHFESALTKLKNKNSNSKNSNSKNSNSKNSNSKSNNKKGITLDELLTQTETFSKKRDSIVSIYDSIDKFKNSFKKEKFKNNSKNTAESFEKFYLFKDKFFEIFK